MKTRHVYYDEKTGRITDILKEKKDVGDNFIECDIDEVVDFLSMKKSFNEYIVAYNKTENKHVLMKKDNVIRFRKQSKVLYKIPYDEDSINDITIIYYVGNTLEISLDLSRLSPLYQTSFKDDIKFEKGTELRLFLKEKNTGTLLKEIIIDAQELLESGQLFYDLEDNIKSDNVELFTYQMFESYTWYKASVRLISPVKEGIKFDIHKADHKVRDKEFFYHLIVDNYYKKIRIHNNITNLNQIRFERDIDFFIVDEHDPNILYESFSLSEDQLKQEVIMIDCKVDLKGKTILYNHKYISLLIKEK